MKWLAAACLAAAATVAVASADQRGRERRQVLPADADVGVVSVKTEPGRLYFASRHAIRTLDESTPLEWTFGPKLRAAAAALTLQVLGPTEYHVRFNPERCGGLDEARTAAKELLIALPVRERVPPADGFELTETAEYLCLSLLVKGSPMQLTPAWTRLYEEAASRGRKPSCENRQLIVDHSGFNAAEHLTELQLGIEQ